MPLSRYTCRVRVLLIFLLSGVIFLPPSLVAQPRPTSIADETVTLTQLLWTPHVSYERLTLRVGGPDGQVQQAEFTPGQAVVFTPSDEQGKPLPDGVYTYELVVTPMVEPSVKAAIQQAKQEEIAGLMTDLQRQGLLPRQPLIQGGHFVVTNGLLSSPTTTR